MPLTWNIENLTIKLKHTFVITTSRQDDTKVTVYTLSDGQHTGIGAGVANNVTLETQESMAVALEQISQAAVEMGSTDPEELLPALAKRFAASPSAMMAFDGAIYDLAGRKAGLSVGDYLSRQFGTSNVRQTIATDHTIGFGTWDFIERSAREYVQRGFRILKLKIGGNFDEDFKTLSRLRQLVGPDIGILADANQGFSVQQALKIADEMHKNNYLFLEQPTPKDDLPAMAEVTRHSPVPIFADEAVRTLELARRICGQKMAHGINIKLAKFGGIRQGIEAVKLAEASDMDVMVGCYTEVSPSLAAGMHFARAFARVRYADIDGNQLMLNEPFAGLDLKQGLLQTEGPGLGIRSVKR
jgi:L-alanine-DL-glutamate epimerase-like enolase superfamily enzyme